MNTKVMMLLLLVAVVLVAAGCARFFSKGHSKEVVTHAAYADVNVSEFQTLIADPDMQLLDVRTQDEFDEGHIAGSILVDVGDADFVDKAAAVLDKQRPVAVYCRSGRRSRRAAALLDSFGYTRLYDLGSLIGWPYGLE
jgi:rhodanese-related sulfurtransferase